MPEYRVSRGGHNCQLQNKRHGLPEPGYWRSVPPGGNFPNGKSYVVPEFEAIDGLISSDFSSINAVDNSGKSIYHGCCSR
jgi:hypothetical protein